VSLKERIVLNKISEKEFGKGIIILLILALFSTMLLFGCTEPKEQEGNLQKYENYDDLVAAFKDAQNSDYGYRGGLFDIMTSQAMAETTGSAQKTNDSSAGTDYSKTNVQVEGVDEADIIKTDGKYIYTFSQNKLVITEAYPIEDSKIVLSKELEDIYPTEMFINGNKLVLFGTKSDYYGGYPEYRIMCYDCWWGGKFISQTYDITDKSNPVLEKEIETEGTYLSSRMIGNNIYFIINSYPLWYDYYPISETESPMEVEVVEGSGEGTSGSSGVETAPDYEKEDYYDEQKPQEAENIIPLVKIDGIEERIAAPDEIGFIPGVMPQNFMTIYSLNTETMVLEKETITSSGQNVYASLNNLYIADTTWQYAEYDIDTNGNVLAEIGKPIAKAIAPLNYSSQEKTIISKFKLDNGKVSFIESGSAPGRVLNQFSMDEYNDYFRIATTVGNWWTNEQSSNNVYIFDSQMNMVSSIEDLAPGEQIYSARFMGEKGYIVTFKTIDPLFVLDLNPEAPKVLGQLKIPGYSDYLHPIDETHLIGLGKDTIESVSGDVAWQQGIKMAIFDVTDVTNPIELHKVIIGERGTESYALHDHKAFLFDKEKELLIIPITLAMISEQTKQDYYERGWEFPPYGEPVFQGAFIFNVSIENGINERGRITHVTAEDELKRGYYYGDNYSIKRSLYIENILYTLSTNTLKANNLTTLEELKVFELSEEDPNQYYWEYPISDGLPSEDIDEDTNSEESTDSGNETELEKIYCTEEQKQTEACYLIYAPVCGDNGVTYGNDCAACSSKEIEYYMDGEC
jgi:inhibitor of cysteine peptidase